MKRIRITRELFMLIKNTDGVTFHGSFSDPFGFYGQPSLTTGYGVEGVGQIIESKTKWDAGTGTREIPERVNETHEYWLTLRKENE